MPHGDRAGTVCAGDGVVEMRPIRLPIANHMAPSGPAVSVVGEPSGVMEYSVITPAVVMRPILPVSMNHRAPSGPAAIESGRDSAVKPVEYSVMTPAVVMRPIRLPQYSVNQRARPGPATIERGDR